MILTVAILADQLLTDHPAIAYAQAITPSHSIRIMLVESQARIKLHQYQRHKLILVISALRHYAAMLQQRGFAVDYYQTLRWRTALQQQAARYPDTQIITMAGSEYAARHAQQQWQNWVPSPVTIIANQQFLVSQHNPLAHTATSKRTVMEPFYRAMRQYFGVLIEADGTPIANRSPLPGPSPTTPTSPPTPLPNRSALK